ncbi:hypothetical protein GCM10022223_05330 [Kineosporia mesophila]|uniref:DUF5666 domain-containing protein n=1 Tax=Kineosporia mesophila TaxID=566012 RepID=A0ABP6YZI5_9ACTN|nr:hypothetical protein [Kineosporia mesophila]MCD5354257.1 hypothetical protein [Kineosporia mesophila]
MTDDSWAQLRDRLRDVDPAASLAPLPDDDVSLRIEQSMKTRPQQSFWNRKARPVAAAALLAAAAAGLFAGLGNGPGNGSGPDPANPPSIERVTMDTSGAAAKCAPPTAELLRTADLAVEGTVRSVSNGVVTLDVSQVWTGDQVDVLDVAQTSGATEVLLGGTSFEVGRTYLVAVQDGRVRQCGYSGVASPELRALFDAAF